MTSEETFIGDTDQHDLYDDLPNISSTSRVLNKDDFLINRDNLSRNEFNDFQELLLKNVDVFSTSLADLGYCPDYEMSIDTGDNKPFHSHFYRTTPELQEVIDEQIDELLKFNIVEPSLSAWASPCVLVKKPGKDPKTGKQRYRLVQDFRGIKSLTADISYPISRFDDLLYDVGSKHPKYYSKLDMNSAFHQFPITPRDRHKTAFVTKHGHYQYNRVCFGLKSSPIFFTSAMSQILSKFIKDKKIFLYADDLVVMSSNCTRKCMKILRRTRRLGG